MANEAKTVRLTNKMLDGLGYYDDRDIVVEEQKSDNRNIAGLLSKASKAGTGNPGMPEFIIWKNNKDMVLLIECKASTKHHESQEHDSPKDYAVDGVLHYAKFIKNKYNVVAVAISGQTEKELTTSVFFWNRGDSSHKKMPYCKLDMFDRYYNAFYPTGSVDTGHLRAFAHKLHNEIRSKAKLMEAEKPLFVGAILLALSEPHFKLEYKELIAPRKLATHIISAIDDKFKESGMDEDKRASIVDQFRFIRNKTMLLKKPASNPKGNNRHNSPLHEFVYDIDENMGEISLIAENQDVMGEFYNEFIRYTGGDGKGLGVVLTPFHITELFVDIAGIHKNSRVIDICMGTGGFLVSAMKKMLSGDLTVPEIQAIRKSNLFGVEAQPSIFALACVNMFVRGDGKANLVKGDCHDNDSIVDIPKCTVGMLNPPYSQKQKGESELEFIRRTLEMLDVDGICIAIVPLSCTSGNNEIRKKLLQEHTLEAVMNMPDDLFPNENTHTCVMVFRAHKKHGDETETWLSVWGDDGHQKMKNRRMDRYGKWPGIKKNWLKEYRGKSITPHSLLHHVKHNDEWSALEYLPTDYTRLTRAKFLNVVCGHRLAIMRREGIIKDDQYETHIAAVLNLTEKERSIFKRNKNDYLGISTEKWETYKISEYFSVKGSKTTPLDFLLELEESNPKARKKYPYVTTKETNTGIEGYYPYFTENGNVIYTDSATNGHSNYRHDNFSASDHVEVLTPKPGIKFDKYVGLFIETILNLETFRYGYGRKFNQIRIRETEILLPTSNGSPDWEFMREYIKKIDKLDWF